MRAFRDLASLNIGVTYDLVVRGQRPFRGRLLTVTGDGAVFIVDGDQYVISAERFVSAKPVTGSWRRR